MSDIDKLYKLPDVSFIDNMTLDDVKNKAIELYEEAYQKATGKAVTLADADPDRLKLYATSYLVFQALQYIDKMGKMQLNKYSEGDFLRHLAAWKKVEPLEQQSARTKQRFYVQNTKSTIIAIPQGTRVTGDYNVFFETEEYAEIEVGALYVDVDVVCTVPGKDANGFEAGYLNVLVDPIPYISKTENLDTTDGGTDEESDESLRQRAYDAPGSYSTSGSELSYQYWTKTFSSNIIDQKILSPSPDCMDIYVLMKNGELPTEEQIRELEEYIDTKTKRTLNDKVTVKAPEQVGYDIDITYYIATENVRTVQTIQRLVNEAVSSYISWQDYKIGRDIDIGELSAKLRNAGAKRVVINNSVSYKKLNETQVAKAGIKNIQYGGLEDD